MPNKKKKKNANPNQDKLTAIVNQNHAKTLKNLNLVLSSHVRTAHTSVCMTVHSCGHHNAQNGSDNLHSHPTASCSRAHILTLSVNRTNYVFVWLTDNVRI